MSSDSLFCGTLGSDGVSHRRVSESRADIATLEVLLPARWDRFWIISVMVEHLLDEPVIGSKVSFKGIYHAY